MSSNYTPGPWRITLESVVTRLFGGNDKLIAELRLSEGNKTANARLIEAAPDMLKLLKRASNLFYTLGDKDSLESQDCFALYEECEQMITKATGKE